MHFERRIGSSRSWFMSHRGPTAEYLSVSVKVSRRIGGRKKSHAFRIQINAREMHEHLLNDFVTCELVTD